MPRRGVSRDVGLAVRMVAVLLALLAVYAGVAALGWLFAQAHPPLFAFVLVLPAAEIFLGGKAFLGSAGVREPRPAEAASLEAALERLAAMADISPPALGVIDSPVPNAFAIGRTQAGAVVAVTTALLRELDERELEAVLAHEVAHVANRDAAVMSTASTLTLLGGRLFYSPVWPVAVVVLGIGSLITLALSRYREYAADRGSALLTGHPEHLMSALVKISDEMRIAGKDLREVYALSAFLIVSLEGRRFEFLLDHPPLEKRLARLQAIAQTLGEAA